jgi:hypothetical protein
MPRHTMRLTLILKLPWWATSDCDGFDLARCGKQLQRPMCGGIRPLARLFLLATSP